MNKGAGICRASVEESDAIAEIIRAAFHQIAERYAVASQPSSPYPLLPSADWIRRTMNRGVEYFLLRQNEQPIGCAALIKISADVLFMDRLAVLPEHQREGWGQCLVQHCLETARQRNMKRLETGVPADLLELIEWYRLLGFRFKQLARFNELPFNVAFLYFDLKMQDASLSEELSMVIHPE